MCFCGQPATSWVRFARVRREHPLIVALVESFAREAKLEPQEVWSWLDKRSAPPPEIRRLIVDAFFPLVSPNDFLSTSPEDGSTIRTMRTEEFEPPKKGRPSVVEHPLFEALAKHGVTLAEEADNVKRSPSSLRSFCYPKGNPHRRPAPEDLKKRWRDLYGVSPKAWR